MELKEETAVRSFQKSATPKGQRFKTDFVVYMHRYIPLDGRMFPHLEKTRYAADADRPDVFQSGSSSTSIPPFFVQAGNIFFERCSRRAEELAIRIAWDDSEWQSGKDRDCGRVWDEYTAA